MRHNETREQAKSAKTVRVLGAPLTAHWKSSETERPLPAFALPPTLRQQLVVLLSIGRTDSFLKLQAPVDERLQRRERVLTHLSYRPTLESSKRR